MMVSIKRFWSQTQQKAGQSNDNHESTNLQVMTQTKFLIKEMIGWHGLFLFDADNYPHDNSYLPDPLSDRWSIVVLRQDSLLYLYAWKRFYCTYIAWNWFQLQLW